MKKEILIGLIIIGILILLGAYIFIMLNGLEINNFLNKNFNGINKNCSLDSDCIIMCTDCSGCPSVEPINWNAVNKKWGSYCPIKWGFSACARIDPYKGYNAACKNNECVLKKG